MADYLHSDVMDNGLVTLTNATSTVLHICSAQPANYAGIAAVTLGNKTSPSVGSPGARTPNGRKVTIAAVTTGGSVTANGTAGFFAFADGTRLLAAGDLAATQVVTIGNTFTLAAIDVGMADPT